MVNIFEEWSADDIYDLMAGDMGREELNEEIVKAISEEELIDILAYISRMQCMDYDHYHEDENGFQEE